MIEVLEHRTAFQGDVELEGGRRVMLVCAVGRDSCAVGTCHVTRQGPYRET